MMAVMTVPSRMYTSLCRQTKDSATPASTTTQSMMISMLWKAMPVLPAMARDSPSMGMGTISTSMYSTTPTAMNTMLTASISNWPA